MTSALIPFPTQQVHWDTLSKTWEEVMEKKQVKGWFGITTGWLKLSWGCLKIKIKLRTHHALFLQTNNCVRAPQRAKKEIGKISRTLEWQERVLGGEKKRMKATIRNSNILSTNCFESSIFPVPLHHGVSTTAGLKTTLFNQNRHLSRSIQLLYQKGGKGVRGISPQRVTLNRKNQNRVLVHTRVRFQQRQVETTN